MTKIINKKRRKQKINLYYIKKFMKYLTSVLGNLIIDLRIINKTIHIKTTPNNLLALTQFLQWNTLCLFKQLQDIAVIDYPERTLRFHVNYIFHSSCYNANIVVSVQIQEISIMPSITPIFPNANWLEREIWDLYGIFFSNNSSLRRILTDYGFGGYALRKSFPLTGFREIYYNDATKRLSYEPLELSQEARIWEVVKSDLPFMKKE